ncbi:perivitellin-2 67 kDa subunit-like [Physella acuta]|uniref:perivitellin-2 67 kDa subunit-like n=1 Tax=Physella acuta TaxID=109671 RepID=UPI0027DC717E|nr:perivitellin-2 67 kDa subunit-like [Physella acuta]
MFLYIVTVLTVMVGLAQAANCQNLPPGLSKIVQGVDISKLDLLPLDNTGDNGILKPIFDFTCSKGNKWTNSKGVVYDLPDQIVHIDTLPGGSFTSRIAYYKDYKELKNEMSTNVGLDAMTAMFAFSLSASYKKLKHAIDNSSTQTSEASAFLSVFRADVNTPDFLTLDEQLKSYIDKSLNGTFESSAQAYDKIIELFGTHYFSSANFGGYIRVLLETDEKYALNKSESDIKANAKASLDQLGSGKFDFSKEKLKTDEQFKTATHKTVKYYGGETNNTENVDFPAWQSTIEKNPWLYSGKLVPISDLIKDETKKSSMIKAVKNHLLKGFLDELETSTHSLSENFDNFIIKDLWSKAKLLQKNKILSEDDVNALAKTVEDYTNIPTWFSHDTQICFQWKSTGMSSQCNDLSEGVFCSQINNMSSWYHDSTNLLFGGCKLQWKIQSKNFPTWFKDVKLCFQYEATGDKDQCVGATKEKTVCANINTYTPEYMDDTDGRSGGCNMRWKLEVPQTAPLWMQAVRLCFSWKATGDAKQCGVGSPTDQCVIGNNWTKFYLDDTDNSSGGCDLSWGLKTSV